MKTFFEFMTEAKDFSAIKLDTLTKGMKRYSHDPNSVGFIDHELKSNTAHKPLHDMAKKSGYSYDGTQKDRIKDMSVIHHMYSKTAGPYSDHHLTITVDNKTGKVWNISHRTVKDLS